MRYIRAVKCCAGLNHIKNEGVRKEMKIESVQNKVDEYRTKLDIPFG
jgi:hypothetical protein